ncbi:oligoribonuclease [Candidatus Dependentiae bacterium HGW-Dependentiae-1]|nr:MAG: oligoribonuclease [Candidatus Dependentiae bacterium HGW-Dependentiae-1]
MNKKENLIWIDLEMTGLDTTRHVILEIASLVTDSQLAILAEGPSLVIHQPEENLQNMHPWVLDQHTKSGLLDRVRASTVSLVDAQEQTLTFLRHYCESNSSPLCGNSVWNDRAFLQVYMPPVASFLHYRMIDVTSFKEMVARWYPHNPLREYKKEDKHRALDDIRESVAELCHYRKNFFI